MVDRQEVEALVREIEEGCREHSCTPHDMSLDVEGDILLALCRAWMALDGAPSVAVTECNQLAGTPDFDYGDMLAAVAGLPIGTTVRIVPEAGQEVGK